MRLFLSNVHTSFCGQPLMDLISCAKAADALILIRRWKKESTAVKLLVFIEEPGATLVQTNKTSFISMQLFCYTSRILHQAIVVALARFMVRMFPPVHSNMAVLMAWEKVGFFPWVSSNACYFVLFAGGLAANIVAMPSNGSMLAWKPKWMQWPQRKAVRACAWSCFISHLSSCQEIGVLQFWLEEVIDMSKKQSRT